MKKGEIVLLVCSCIALFILVYTPHFSYPWPLHIDEWHHLTEAYRLRDGSYSSGTIGYRIGFHVLLSSLSFVLPLVEIYAFLPALWAVVSGLTLFFVVKKKSNNFWLAWFALLFFASIKSNVNVLGTWFFTPLSFSIPFLLLYLHWFDLGLRKDQPKLLLRSFLIMLGLLFIYPLSVLFAVPLLFILIIFNKKAVRKNWKLLSLFIVLPVFGVLLYWTLHGGSFVNALTSSFLSLRFPFGWGTYERNITLSELYSPVGYLLAGIGFLRLLTRRKELRDYKLFLVWPVSVLVLIAIFLVSWMSYLSPYQRNMYYFVLALPVLSAWGALTIFQGINKALSLSVLSIYWQSYLKIALSLVLIALIGIFTFVNYAELPDDTEIYHIVEEQDIEALDKLAYLPNGKVIAPLDLSVALYAITSKEPLGALLFYGDKEEVERFYAGDCALKNELIEKHDIRYVYSKDELSCGWETLHTQERYLYMP